jgi:hypothetical protein
MKYQNNKDLAEAQYYLKMLDDFCKSGQVKVPDPTGTAMPWNLKEDPLKDYLIHLFTLKVTIEETGEEVQKFVRQVVNSKIKSKVFYDSVGKFIVECVHHMRFQRQRAWTESHRADDVLDWAPFKRMDEQVWLPLLDQLEQEHAEDGFDKPFFLKLMTGDGASKPENWERLVRDWKVCIDHQVLNKLKDFISLRQNNFETGLVRMMDQITRNMKTKGVSEQRAVQAWELMTNGWTETEFERRLNQVKIQDKYPEIKEIVAKMGRVADANGKDRLTIASGVEMKMEHSAGSDIEGITVGDDLNSLLPLVIPSILRIPAYTMIFDVLSKRILHLHEFVCKRRKEGTDHDVSDSIPLFRFLPQTMVDRQQIADIHLFPILHKGRSAKQADDILPSSVTHIDVSALGSLIHIHGSQRFTDSGNCIKHLLLHANLTDFLRPFSILLRSNLQIRKSVIQSTSAFT